MWFPERDETSYPCARLALNAVDPEPEIFARTRAALEEAQTAAEADLEAARRRQAQLDHDLASATALVDRLRELSQSLADSEGSKQSAQTTHRKSRQGGSDAHFERARWGDGRSRTDAVLESLDREPRPMTLADIVSALHNDGRSDESKSVAATLSYLKRQNKVVNTDGRWERRDLAFAKAP